MRRAAPAPAFRVDPTPAPRWARAERTPRGVGLVAGAAAPEGVRLAADGPVWRPATGAPLAAHEAVVLADGQLALIASPGVARSLRCPQLAQAFDRRPPGLMRVAGAAKANAGLLLADDGWRAVVLPSLGDLATDLGGGPVALRGDARLLAVSGEGEVVEVSLPAGETQARHPGEAQALAYRSDGVLVAGAGAGVGPLGGAPKDGSPVVALAAAADAPVVLARHADGACSLWEGDAADPVATWEPPAQGPLAIGLSPDGAHATLGTPFADPAMAAVVDARDGAVVLGVEGARAIAFGPKGSLVLGAEWGVLWLDIISEEEDG